MNDQVTTVEESGEDPHAAHAKRLATIVYVLQVLGLLFIGVPFLAGAVLNYATYKEVKGTWVAPHFDWQLKTFWVGLIVFVVGGVAIFVTRAGAPVGLAVLFFGAIWMIYRIARGWVCLAGGYNMTDRTKDD